MKKELETIIENEFDCLISELGCLMGDEWKAESIKKVVNQVFALNNNELLNTYTIWLSDKVRDEEELNKLVNDFLKGYNCDTDK